MDLENYDDSSGNVPRAVFSWYILWYSSDVEWFSLKKGGHISYAFFEYQ